MRKLISVLVLAVYSIVMAHNFIPHHHHSGLAENIQKCTHAKHHSHHEHEYESNEDSCIKHEHQPNEHTYCSFDEETILVKKTNLTDLHLPSTEVEFIGIDKKLQSVSDYYIPIQTQDPICWDIKLRGPPQFS